MQSSLYVSKIYTHRLSLNAIKHYSLPLVPLILLMPSRFDHIVIFTLESRDPPPKTNGHPNSFPSRRSQSRRTLSAGPDSNPAPSAQRRSRGSHQWGYKAPSRVPICCHRVQAVRTGDGTPPSSTRIAHRDTGKRTVKKRKRYQGSRARRPNHIFPRALLPPPRARSASPQP
jgi:hypothetical protein